MNKYLFEFKNQTVLVDAESKIKAIELLNKTFPNLLDNDFRAITIAIEINSKGEIINGEE